MTKWGQSENTLQQSSQAPSQGRLWHGSGDDASLGGTHLPSSLPSPFNESGLSHVPKDWNSQKCSIHVPEPSMHRPGAGLRTTTHSGQKFQSQNSTGSWGLMPAVPSWGALASISRTAKSVAIMWRWCAPQHRVLLELKETDAHRARRKQQLFCGRWA